MTSAARRDVAPAGLRPGRVTAKTGRVSAEICGYGHGDTATHGTMTSDAVDAAHRQMFRMIELHAKANQPRGKWFERAGLYVSVTNGANRTLRILKLLRVTPGAR